MVEAFLSCFFCPPTDASLDVFAHRLHGGIQVKIKEYEQFVCGTLAQCHADNLGRHCIGGFMESFTATKPCRVCDGTRDDFQTKV